MADMQLEFLCQVFPPHSVYYAELTADPDGFLARRSDELHMAAYDGLMTRRRYPRRRFVGWRVVRVGHGAVDTYRELLDIDPTLGDALLEVLRLHPTAVVLWQVCETFPIGSDGATLKVGFNIDPGTVSERFI